METPRNKILYVDDENENLVGFKYVFKKFYLIFTASSAADGLKVLEENPDIKLVLTDQRMPKLTGIQFLEKVTNQFPDIYRIIITAYTDIQEIIEAINKGKIYQFIRKPWDKEEVKIVIDNAIQAYDLRAENNQLVKSLKQSNYQLEELNKNLELLVVKRTREIELKNIELEENHSNLEKIVKQRTLELEIAKQKAEESDRLKSAFLSNISHEIRTPMNAIMGFSELMLCDTCTIDERMEFKQQIVINSEALLRLIDDIIDISQIEADQIALNFSDFDLHKMFDDLFKMFDEEKKIYGRWNIEIINDKSAEDQLFISTDKLRLHQILANLICNAVKFTDEGRVCYGYKIVNEEYNRPFLQFYIKDTGIGIPQDAHNYIFERFRKADITNNKIFRGTGLGLFICKNLVEKFGGELWLESEVGKGTTFYFTIPFLPGNKSMAENVPTYAKLDFKNYNFSGKSIIVAEDEDSSYLFIESVMRDTHANLVRAKNGLETIDLLQTMDKVDLVLLDLHMPVMNGYQTISHIKESNIEVPIIAQSAYILMNQMDETLKSSCKDFIPKPFKTFDLLETIKKHI